MFARCLHGPPPQGPVHWIPKTEGSGARRRVSPAGPARQGAPQLSTLQRVTQEARGWGGRGAKHYHPRGPPPSPACDWLGGRECPPRRAGGSPWAPGGAGGAGRAGPGGAGEGRARGSRGSLSGLGEAGRASGGGGSPAGSALSREGERERASECSVSRRSARSRSRQSARPRSLPGGSGAGAGCSLTCRPFPAGRRRRTEGRVSATHLSRSQRLGPRAGHRLHGDRARGARLRTFGRGGEFLPRALWGGDEATPLCASSASSGSRNPGDPERSRAVGDLVLSPHPGGALLCPGLSGWAEAA